MWNGYQIAGAILIVGGAIGGLLFWYGGKIQQDKSGREQTKEIKKSVVESGAELISGQDRILKAIISLHKRLDEGQADSKKVIRRRAEKTYEVARNYNASFLVKEGYEKKGQIGAWFTPMWEGVNTRKFFLADFVGGLEKDRISIFFDKAELVYRILTSDGRNATISLDTTSWKKGRPYLIFAAWDTNKDWAQLYAGERGDAPPQIEEQIIHNLHFDKLGPLVFMGIDFEGKFPAKLQPGSLKLTDSQVLKKMGYSKYKE